jgi:hypothetical protein
MQILHPFAGSVQQYIEQLADPDSYRPGHCPQCQAKHPLTAHGFYTRTVIDTAFDGVIRVRRYLCEVLSAHCLPAARVRLRRPSCPDGIRIAADSYSGDAGLSMSRTAHISYRRRGCDRDGSLGVRRASPNEWFEPRRI